VISAGNNAGRGSSYPSNPGHDPIHITSSGWYVFKHRFYNAGGALACDLSILDSGGNTVHTWTLGNPADLIDTVVGGNRYGWFASNELPVLAFDDAARVQSTVDSRRWSAASPPSFSRGWSAGPRVRRDLRR